MDEMNDVLWMAKYSDECRWIKVPWNGESSMFWSMCMNGMKCLLNGMSLSGNVQIQVCMAEWCLMEVKKSCVKCNEWESNQWMVIGEWVWMAMYDGKGQRLISNDVQWICDKVIDWEWVGEWLVNEWENDWW